MLGSLSQRGGLYPLSLRGIYLTFRIPLPRAYFLLIISTRDRNMQQTYIRWSGARGTR